MADLEYNDYRKGLEIWILGYIVRYVVNLQGQYRLGQWKKECMTRMLNNLTLDYELHCRSVIVTEIAMTHKIQNLQPPPK